MDADIEVYQDQFTNLANGHTATMLVLPISLGLTKGATLTIYEIDSGGTRTGLFGTGFVKAIASGEFYNLPPGQNQYYLNPLNMFKWIDYSSSSTVVGFSAFTAKQIKYCVIGSTVFWSCYIDGTSNSASFSFDLPYNAASGITQFVGVGRIANNGTGTNNPGMSLSTIGSNVITLRQNLTNGAWTTVNRKFFFGTGFYEKA